MIICHLHIWKPPSRTASDALDYSKRHWTSHNSLPYRPIWGLWTTKTSASIYFAPLLQRNIKRKESSAPFLTLWPFCYFSAWNEYKPWRGAAIAPLQQQQAQHHRQRLLTVQRTDSPACPGSGKAASPSRWEVTRFLSCLCSKGDLQRQTESLQFHSEDVCNKLCWFLGGRIYGCQALC